MVSISRRLVLSVSVKHPYLSLCFILSRSSTSLIICLTNTGVPLNVAFWLSFTISIIIHSIQSMSHPIGSLLRFIFPRRPIIFHAAGLDWGQTSTWRWQSVSGTGGMGLLDSVGWVKWTTDKKRVPASLARPGARLEGSACMKCRVRVWGKFSEG